MTPSAGIANPVEAVLAQNLAQVLGLAVVGGGQADAESLDAPASDLDGELVEPPGEARDFLGLQDELGRAGNPGRPARRAGHQAQLDELAAGEPLAERRLGRCLLVRPVKELRRIDDDRRRRGQIVEQSRAAGRLTVLGNERQHEQLVERRHRALR